ncbi:deleted in lung and esophageal cancer 1-like, partial [Brachionus plicatilis]
MSLSPQVPSSHSLRDPSTFLQRPTSAKIPDVSHLLNSIFGDKYNKEKLSVDVVKNLSISSDVDNQYHKRYVQKLKEAQLVKESRIQEYAMLEKHILEAQAKALAYEDREEDKRMKTCQDPDLFGVPPTKSYFSYCLDDTILKDHNLLVPSDYYFKPKRPFVPMPKNDDSERYLEETVSSKERFKHKILPPINSSRKFDIEELG